MTSELENGDSFEDLATEISEIAQQQSLRDHVAESMQRYFQDLDGQDTKELYSLVMAEVEPPLLEAAMKYTRNNQSKTAALLGLNRGTLRKKLKQYNLL
jgi:Fis family transcriptional regulator